MGARTWVGPVNEAILEVSTRVGVGQEASLEVRACLGLGSEATLEVRTSLGVGSEASLPVRTRVGVAQAGVLEDRTQVGGAKAPVHEAATVHRLPKPDHLRHQPWVHQHWEPLPIAARRARVPATHEFSWCRVPEKMGHPFRIVWAPAKATRKPRVVRLEVLGPFSLDGGGSSGAGWNAASPTQLMQNNVDRCAGNTYVGQPFGGTRAGRSWPSLNTDAARPLPLLFSVSTTTMASSI